MVAEVRKRWESFVVAFNALGSETRGMTPAAASLLLLAALDYVKDNTGGYQPIPAGVPGFALCTQDGLTVDIRNDYLGCSEFWDIDMNYPRAKITEAGVAYVNAHFDVFSILKK